jgi:hypothetical protein
MAAETIVCAGGCPPTPTAFFGTVYAAWVLPFEIIRQRRR